MLHSLSTAWRQLIASPLFSLITIASLSIGCCGALLAGANIKQHLSFERGFKDADRILLARMRDGPNPDSKHPLASANAHIPPGVFNYSIRPAIAPMIEGKLPGVLAMTRVVSDASPLVETNNEPTNDVARLVDRSFFDVFEHHFVEGSRETAFESPESVVLTRERAQELLGNGPWLGKTLRGSNGITRRVSAVIDKPPQPTMFNFTVLSAIPETGDYAKNFQTFGYSRSGGLYIRIRDGVDRAAFIAHANAAIKEAYPAGLAGMMANMNKQLAEAHMPPLTMTDFDVRVSLMPITDIHLAPREATGVTSTGEISMLVALAGAAAALLAVSGFNYVVLSLARALRRRREVGLRKVLGASSSAVTAHYLAEAGLVTAISLAFGFGLAELLQPWFARTLGQPEILFNLYDPVFLVSVAAAFLALMLLVGAYPALYLANIRPRTGIEDADEGGGRLRRRITGGLLGVQIMAATILLTTALTMTAQAAYVAARPLGFNMENLHVLRPDCGMRATTTMAAYNLGCTSVMSRIVRETPGLKRVGWSSNPGIFVSGEPAPIVVPGVAGPAGRGFTMDVDADFLPLVGAKLLAGRLLDGKSAYDRRELDAYPHYPSEPFDSVPVVVTRAMLPIVGAATPKDALGKRLMVGKSLWTNYYEIVGVIEDWHQRSLKYAVAPIAFSMGGSLMYPVAEIDPANVADVQQRLSPVGGYAGGDFGPFRMTVSPVSQAFQDAYQADRSLMGAVIGFAGLSILVAGLGVFGLSAFEIQRRVREIGIRKALGAAPASVAGMVMGRSLLSAAVASILSWPFGWWIANSWLSGYAYRTSLGPVVLPVATLVVLAFVALAVLLNTVRAAAIRPGSALRSA